MRFKNKTLPVDSEKTVRCETGVRVPGGNVRGDSREKTMDDYRYQPTTQIPAGKHAGKFRGPLENSFRGYGWRSRQNPKQNCDTVACGACRKVYRAMKFTCPHCGGPHGEDDEDSDTGVTHE